MGSFNLEIPSEYLDGTEDFGFTTVDSTEFEQREKQEREITEDVAEELASNLVNEVGDKISGLEGKVNSILLRLEDKTDNDFVADDSGLLRIEEKVDKILAMENTEMVAALSEQGDNIRAIIDEVEERKSQLDDQYKEKLTEVEKMVLPLLINLTKNPEQEYIRWPGRAEKVKSHIHKILGVTRG